MANIKKPPGEATTILNVTITRGQLDEIDANYDNRSEVIREALNMFLENNGTKEIIEKKMAKIDNEILELQKAKKVLEEKLCKFIEDESRKEEIRVIRKTKEYREEIYKLAGRWANIMINSTLDEKNRNKMAQMLEETFNVPYKTIIEDTLPITHKLYGELRIANMNNKGKVLYA